MKKSFLPTHKIYLFLVFVFGIAHANATTPVNGTTTFNNNFSGATNLLGATANSATVLNVGSTALLASGWDFNVSAPGGNVSMAAAAAGANPGGATDFCIRMNSVTIGTSVQTTGVKTNDGSEHTLQSVYLKLNIVAGTTANMTITGYRNNSPVSGATKTVSGIATTTWVQFDLSGIAGFYNVDEFRFTQTGTSASFSFEAVDQITIAPANTLPLTLINFEGQLNDNHAQLTWSTATEQHTNSFEVQQGIDGIRFTPIGNIQATGNSTTLHSYNFTTPGLSPGTNFFRLKMIDDDNDFSFSPVIKINVPQQGMGLSANVFPNPINSKSVLTILAGTEQNAEITISDGDGKMLMKKASSLHTGTNIITLPETNLWSKGIYYLVIISGNKKQTISLVKTN